jgi:hypothetical protein
MLELGGSLPLDSFIETASTEAHKRMMAFLNRDKALMKAVKDIHDFVLLQRGDFAVTLMEVDRDSIPMRLGRIIRLFSDHLIQEIDFEIGSAECQLAYRAMPPISALFGQTELTAYKLVSVILLKLKRAEFDLVRCRRHSRNRVWLILIAEMLGLVRLLSDFLNLHVMKKSYQNLVSICEDAANFDDVLKAHSTHVAVLARGCWMTESGRGCRSVISDVLKFIERVASSEDAARQNRAAFHEMIMALHTAVLNHQASGRELGKPIARMFPYIFEPKKPV